MMYWLEHLYYIPWWFLLFPFSFSLWQQAFVSELYRKENADFAKLSLF